MQKILNALLGFCVMFDSYKVIKFLFWLGASPNSRNDKGHAHFGGAVVFELLNTARAFIEHPDFNLNLEMITGKGTSGLMLAGSLGHVKVVKLLLDAGADVYHVDKKGVTVLDNIRAIQSSVPTYSKMESQYNEVLALMEQAAAR